jgi:hypothetical protein
MEGESQGNLPGEGRVARVSDWARIGEAAERKDFRSHAKPAAESYRWRK